VGAAASARLVTPLTKLTLRAQVSASLFRSLLTANTTLTTHTHTHTHTHKHTHTHTHTATFVSSTGGGGASTGGGGASTGGGGTGAGGGGGGGGGALDVLPSPVSGASQAWVGLGTWLATLAATAAVLCFRA
jgi:hypothetical protein